MKINGIIDFESTNPIYWHINIKYKYVVELFLLLGGTQKKSKRKKNIQNTVHCVCYVCDWVMNAESFTL